jgi:SAM-dependent methyltransferase
MDLRLLDVGCAMGFLLRHLRVRGYDVRGVDFSQYALDHAPEDILPYLSQFDLTDLATRIEHWHRPFDVVTCFETLEHVPAVHSGTAAQHLWSALKPGGLAILTICVEGQPGADTDPTHVNVAPRSYWDDLFAEQGWTVEEEMLRQLRWFWLFSQHRGVFCLRRP